MLVERNKGDIVENVKALLLQQVEDHEESAKSSRKSVSFHQKQVELYQDFIVKSEKMVAECRAAIEKLS